MPTSHRTTARSILALLLLWASTGTGTAAVPERILFPVVGKASFTDDFGAPRSGHPHQGNDIVAARGAPVVAVEGGVVKKHRTSSGGDCMLYLEGRSGTTYHYIHLNNDVTRENDNRAAACQNGVAYARGLRSVQPVRRGELIGYVGDSGNADGGQPHLHFELHPDGGAAVSPYDWLTEGRRLLYAVPGGTERVRLALYGTVRSTENSFSVRLRRLAVSRGWRGAAVSRDVALAYGPRLVVERRSEPGTVTATALTTAEPGERVTVWTTWFSPSLATQVARSDSLVAAVIRLRGTAS